MEAQAEQRQLPPGTMLDEKYRVESLLAVGGMGAVYVGTHLKLRKRVAIKVLNPELATPSMIERFHREAITASQIGHEGIAQVTDFGTSAQGETFLVMEFLDGESLGKRLARTGALPIDVACELACAILSPLEAAHRAGIVHRDLKPDNVFLVRQSRGEMVKLLDFGISRTQGLESEFRLTTTGLVLGTPYYMSPEQARGDNQVTHSADLYAIGVMLYEMLCGEVPIKGENYNQLMYKVMTGEYRPPRMLKPEIPVALEQLILQTMALEPQQRPGSAAALEQSLLAFCRPTFREHTIERTSAPGFAPSLTPQPMSRSGHQPQFATDQTVMAPTQARQRKSRAVVIGVVALLVIGGGIAGIIAATGGGAARPAPAPVAMPAPPPQPVEPPAKPVEPPAKPAEAGPITLHFTVVPASADIEIDGKPAANPLSVTKDDASHKLHITAKGYLPHDEDIRFDETQRLSITLEHQAKLPKTPNAPAHPTKEGKKPDKIESQSPYE